MELLNNEYTPHFLKVLLLSLFTQACSTNLASSTNNFDTSNATPSLDHYTQADKAIFGSAFIYSVTGNDLFNASRLITLGADVNEPSPVNEIPLLIAIKNNSVDMVRLLLKHNAKPNYYDEPVSCSSILAQGSGGDTRFFIMPLEVAQKKRNQSIITLLKDAGAKSASECFQASEAERRLLESLAPRY